MFNEGFATRAAIILLSLLGCILAIWMTRQSKARARFILGSLVFGVYTIVALLAFRIYSNYAVTVEDCLKAVSTAFVVMNIMVLGAAFLFYIARDKRKLSELDKMKLKDL